MQQRAIAAINPKQSSASRSVTITVGGESLSLQDEAARAATLLPAGKDRPGAEVAIGDPQLARLGRFEIVALYPSKRPVAPS